MYCFFDPNNSVVPYRIMGSTYAASPSDQPGSMGGLPCVYVDDAIYPDVVANLGLYKIDPATMEPVHLTQAEIDALNAAAPAHEPTAEEKLAALQKEHNILKQSSNATYDALNGLIDCLGSKGMI